LCVAERRNILRCDLPVRIEFSKRAVLLRMIASSIIDKTHELEVLGFLNDVIPVGSKIGKYKKIKVVGTSDDIEKYLAEEDVSIFVAYIGMTREKEIYEKLEGLKIPPDRFIRLIDPSAIIPHGYCSIGSGVLFAPLSQLSPDTTIGDNCILLPNSFIGHDSTLDRFVSVANNAAVGANVHVGKGVHIGSNATIREKIKIGEFSLVGQGSVVLEDVPPNSIVVGNPARVLRTQ
jgi:acetyltransferase EpsM